MDDSRTIAEITLVHPELVLTPTQRETLETAYEHGYFDDPRNATVAELANQLEVSASAVSGRLRRGTKALLEDTVLR